MPAPLFYSHEILRTIRDLRKAGDRSAAGLLPDADRLMELIAQDKKVQRGRLTFILVRGIGQAFVAPDVDAAEVRAFLVEKLAER